MMAPDRAAARIGATDISALVCAGCGYLAPPEEPYPFRCPGAETASEIDHVLTRVIALERARGDRSWQDIFLSTEPDPFIKFRRLFHAYHTGRAGGLADEDYVAIVSRLEGALARIAGAGFRASPLERYPTLERELRLGPRGALWVKDETGSVGGSHKGRHLMAVLIWLEIMRRLGRSPGPEPDLGVASCGNAALAAAILAQATGRRLHVFIPPDAPQEIVEQLVQWKAHLSVCPRETGVFGDPCILRFRDAVARGALAFTCQGPENGLIIEGGATLAWEMIAVLSAQGRELDRVFVQVGGGALASSCIQAFREAQAMRLIRRLPRIHAVQTESVHPLARAYARLTERLLRRCGKRAGDGLAPEEGDARAQWIQERVPREILEEELRHAVTHRSDYMQPWEAQPRSIATGILDDETYDWMAILRGMLATGGYPVVVSEERLRAAHALARAATPVPVDPTGSAGLAGALSLRDAGELEEQESLAVLFTGRERGLTGP